MNLRSTSSLRSSLIPATNSAIGCESSLSLCDCSAKSSIGVDCGSKALFDAFLHIYMNSMNKTGFGFGIFRITDMEQPEEVFSLSF